MCVNVCIHVLLQLACNEVKVRNYNTSEVFPSYLFVTKFFLQTNSWNYGSPHESQFKPCARLRLWQQAKSYYPTRDSSPLNLHTHLHINYNLSFVKSTQEKVRRI